MNRHLLCAALLCALLATTGCPKKGGGGPAGVKRCELDLKASGLFAQDGSGASARVIDSADQLIGGEGATGATGDVLLQNDRIRVVIEKPGRVIGPILSGGHIVDADLVRPAGEPGRDAFGRMGLIYALGRVSSVTDVEVLNDGSKGGPAVVASTGHDSEHDLLNLPALVRSEGGLTLKFVVDGQVPLPLRSTTYYVLSPGESRVRALTAFCNDGTTPVQAPLIELMDVGAFDLFNPGGCSNGLGMPGASLDNCALQPSKWFATQGDGVAYGMRSMSLDDLTQPVAANAMLGYGGVVGVFVEGETLNGVLSWTDPDARNRPGAFGIRGGGQKSYLRDFVVARDIAGVSATFLQEDGVTTGRLDVTATLPGGAAAEGARVAVSDAVTGTMVTLVAADASGKGAADLAPGNYTLTGALEGRLIGPKVTATVTAGATTPVAVPVGEGHTLSVTVADPFGAPMPAKVTVLCSGGACPLTTDAYRQHMLLDTPQGGAAAMGYVPVTGQLTLTLPPGEYDVVVSRGPEYSTWPDTWPGAGRHVDLRLGNQAVSAVLGHIVDSTGWMSADLHVHAVNSSDSAVRNELRVANFMAEGVDILLSTDHDVITDFAPVIRNLGAEHFIASMIGEEVTSFSHGHFNAFPLIRKDLPYGGAFDHAGGEDAPTLRLTQLFPGIHTEQPGSVVQINHPRGGGGALSLLKVDTATLASHGDPADFNMAPAPDATADDTKLFGDGFDAFETENGPSPSYSVLNDWMTFLSRGTVKTATGVSDTHTTYGSSGGYGRTVAKLGVDAPGDFTPVAFADAIRARHAFVTNGPFLRVTARKLDAGGQPVGPPAEMGDTVSLSAAANEGLELTVDVQGPEWMLIDRVELYSHAPGRESVNGESNSSWPEGRILDKHVLDVANLPLEAVPGQNGLTLRRLHVTDRFVVHPAADTWFVVMAREVQSGRSMWPMHGARPVAFSNAILVDADGSGRYDDFPLKPGHPLRAVQPPPPPPKVPTPAEFAGAIRKILSHHHE